MERLQALRVLLGVSGLAISLYAIYIKHSKHSDGSYAAYCDIDETVACSDVLTSDYSVGLGLVRVVLGEDHFLNLPNAYYGVLFYPLLIALGLFASRGVLLLSLAVNTISTVLSAYLLYVLFLVLYKICLVCISVHVVNTLLLICSVVQWRRRGDGAALHSTSKKHQ